MRTRTADPRWRIKPCTKCGADDWMYGTAKTCEACLAPSVNNRSQIAAHKAVLWAIKTGKLIREPCVACVTQGLAPPSNSHGHHEDYSKPLDVIWLCPMHHSWVHQSSLEVVLNRAKRVAA